MICLSISFLQAFKVQFFEEEHAKTSLLLSVWYNKTFPLCWHCFSLGSWHSLFPGKEPHFMRLLSQKKCEEPHAISRGRQRFIVMLSLSNEDAKFPLLAATSQFDGIQLYI